MNSAASSVYGNNYGSKQNSLNQNKEMELEQAVQMVQRVN
jgi:hypothetical protein